MKNYRASISAVPTKHRSQARGLPKAEPEGPTSVTKFRAQRGAQLHPILYGLISHDWKR